LTLTNGKTTLAGIGAILTAVGGIVSTWPTPDWTTAIAAILAGIGLIFAKDSKGRDA
jgi:hypothetical protein